MKHPDFKIPNLDPMYEAVVNFVKEHQGEKGYIDCQPSLGWDTVYALKYNDWYGGGIEYFVYAVRVIDNDLEALIKPITGNHLTTYESEDFTAPDENWESVRWGDVYYVPTLFNIAENIWEYIEEE